MTCDPGLEKSLFTSGRWGLSGSEQALLDISNVIGANGSNSDSQSHFVKEVAVLKKKKKKMYPPLPQYKLMAARCNYTVWPLRKLVSKPGTPPGDL